ncbi:MAG: DMT family transporter [Leptothrix ochracea]|uniref:DMT family transporter n=1 Tax=Leptothrix ochracea TaxID=735331 RepID=UPI0034E27B95
MPRLRGLSPTWRHEAVLVFITVLWGSTFLILHTALRWSGPLTLVSARFASAAVLLALLMGPKRLGGLTRHELRAGVLTGLVIAAVYGLQTMGLTQISSSKSAFLTALYVPAVPLLLALFWRQPPRPLAWWGIAAAFGGMVLLAQPAGADWALGKGDALTLAAALMAALEIVLLGQWSPGCDPRRLAWVQTMVVALVGAPLALWHGEGLPQLDAGWVLCVGALALMTAFIQFAMSWAQQTVSATHATLIYALEPVWAGLIGVWAGDRFGGLAWTGSGLILLGLVLRSVAKGSETSEVSPTRVGHVDHT